MDSGTEILRVTAAIVSAFQSAADTLEVIKDRKEKKKRRKDKDVEELLEIKILHKSLVEGGSRCRKHCENRHQQFNPAFEAGDDIAIQALQDVLITLQTEVIQALQLARGVESAVLDLTALHESSITTRKDATRAMDKLCERIIASMQFQPQHKFEGRSPSDYSIRSSFVSNAVLDQKDLPPSPPASVVGSPQQTDYHRAFPRHTSIFRNPGDNMYPRDRYNSIHASPLGLNSSHITVESPASVNSGSEPVASIDQRHHSVASQQTLSRVHTGPDSVVQPPFSEHDRSLQDSQPATATSTTITRYTHDPSNQPQTDPEPPLQHISMLSQSSPTAPASFSIDSTQVHTEVVPSSSTNIDEPLGYVSKDMEPVPEPTSMIENGTTSAIASIEGESRFLSQVGQDHLTQEPSPSLPSADIPSRSSSIFDRLPQDEKTSRPSEEITRPVEVAVLAAVHSHVKSNDYGDRIEAAATSPASATSTPVSTKPQLRPEPNPLCSSSIQFAEDLRDDYEAMEVVASYNGMYTISPVHEQFPEKYPTGTLLTQADYAERLRTLPSGMENIWLPLKRPAMHNRYHGFCKGAWTIRKTVHEGLDVELTSSSKEPVVHWTCKECKFRSKAPKVEAQPDIVLFNQKYAIRYRWMFLAKSHRTAEVECDEPENYTYGCIFCPAQGQSSATYDRLDSLMAHIVSKHKTSMMTPEVQEKTKCVIGTGAIQQKDWDINIPASTSSRVAGSTADELLHLAKRFIRRRKRPVEVIQA